MAAPERARWPRLTAAPQPPLRPLLPRGYAGFTEATAPRHLVLPASTSVSLVVKLLDSPHRPPAFVAGGRGSGWVVEGECAPSYLEVRLAPQLREVRAWRQRFALLDQFLLGRLDRGPRPAPEVAWAWERLVAADGRVPIGRLAAEVGWSHKHLITRFRSRSASGLRPRPG